MDLFDKPLASKAAIEEILQRYESASRRTTFDAVEIVREELLPHVADHSYITTRVSRDMTLTRALYNDRLTFSSENTDEIVDRLGTWSMGVLVERAKVSQYARVSQSDWGAERYMPLPNTPLISAVACRAIREWDVSLANVALIFVMQAVMSVNSVIDQIGGPAVMRELHQIVDDKVVSLKMEQDWS